MTIAEVPVVRQSPSMTDPPLEDDDEWTEPRKLTELEEAGFVLNLLCQGDTEFEDRADAEWRRLQAEGMTADEATLALRPMAAEKLREIAATGVPGTIKDLDRRLDEVEAEG